MSAVTPPDASARRGPPTAAITNLGCKVNQAEVDLAARYLRSRGWRIVADGAPADLQLVNTCTVTAVADQKSRQAVRRARRANPGAAVVVSGCAVHVGRAAIAAADPAARLVAGPGRDALLAELERIVADGSDGPRDASRGARRPLPTLAGVEPAATSAAAELDGVADRRTAVDRTRAFVKVQDGCSFFCTYCIIPAARGPERSLGPEVVLDDVRVVLAEGHREIVLTGINIGTYDGGWSERGARGSHVRSALTLAGLVRRILDETPVERIRLSSIEPQHVDAELLETWAGAGGRCLPHFHLPLQSGDDGVLRRMGRRYTARDYAAIVGRVRAAVPDAAVFADVIVGFPSEDEAAFARTVELVTRLGLAGLHVFRYSERPGTPAVRMTGRVDEATRRRRSAALLEVAAAARARWAGRQVGRTASVLFEEPLADGRWTGHAEDYTLVAALPERPGGSLANCIAPVALTSVDPGVPERVMGTLVA